MVTKLTGQKFKLLLFPCNQFLSQEPDMPTNDTIAKMSQGKMVDVKNNPHIIVFAKIEVNGENTHPVFEYLKYNSSLYDEAKGIVTPIAWNFAKFLVEPTGGVYKHYGPKTDPSTITPDVEMLLRGGLPGTPVRAPSSKGSSKKLVP
mmetsp:Transcript_54293/g.118795  ORF Transcript_54293/g.118795 Transcript_54293/m.118795 type:complete len:147 (+) Transcript_54293:301-741(+)